MPQVKNNSIFMYLFILFLVSCGNGKNNKEYSEKIAVYKDTLERLKYDELHTQDSLFYKLNNGIILSKIEIDTLFLYIKNESIDESQSEALGMFVYESLKFKGLNHQAINDCINNVDQKEREILLEKLVNLMCIDLVEDKYSYDKFLVDFPVFKGSKSAKLALRTCFDNSIP